MWIFDVGVVACNVKKMKLRWMVQYYEEGYEVKFVFFTSSDVSS